MEREMKEVIKLTVVELLAFLENRADVLAVAAEDVFSLDHGYRRRKHGYKSPREVDWQNFKQRVYRLKRKGLIRKTFLNKQYHLEITEVGRAALSNAVLNRQFDKPDKWDKKWRVIMYDIPENDRYVRDIIRAALTKIGFQQIQKSVFVFPYECNQIITRICQTYGERHHIKYMIADIIEGEEDIIEKFLDAHILAPSDIK